jgi:hypothetical protein
MAMATGERARPSREGGRTLSTLRDALRGHPAGPEVAAALGPLADRPAPVGWDRWAPAERERYLDAALDEARAGGRTAA